MKIFIAVLAAVIATTAVAEPPVQAPYPASGWKPDGPAFELPPREPSKFTAASANLEQDSYLPPGKLDQTESSTPSSEYGLPTGGQGLPGAEPLSPFTSATQKTPADSFNADLKFFQQQLEKQQVQEISTLNQGEKPQQSNNFAKESRLKPKSQNFEQQNALFINLNNKDPNPSANLVAAKPLKLTQPQQTFAQQYLPPSYDQVQFGQLNTVPAFAQPQQAFGFAQTQDFVALNPASLAQFSQFRQLNTPPRFVPQEQPINSEQQANDQQNFNQQFNNQLNLKAQQPQFNDEKLVQSFEPGNGNSFRQLAVQYQTSPDGLHSQANPGHNQQISNLQFGQLNTFDGTENGIPQFNQIKSFDNNQNFNTQLGQFKQFGNIETRSKETKVGSEFDQQNPPIPGRTALFGKSKGLETEQDKSFNNAPDENQSGSAQFQQAGSFGQFVAPQFGQLNDIQQAPQFGQLNNLNGYTQQQQFPNPQVFVSQPAPQQFGQIQMFAPSPAFGQFQSFGNQEVIPQANFSPENGNFQTLGQLQSPVGINAYQLNNQDNSDGSETGADDNSSPTQFAFGAKNTPTFDTSDTTGRTNSNVGFLAYGTPVQSYGPPGNRDQIASPKSTAQTPQENADEPSTETNSFDGPNIAISTAVADGRRRRGSARLRNLRRNRPLFTLDKMGRLIRLH